MKTESQNLTGRYGVASGGIFGTETSLFTNAQSKMTKSIEIHNTNFIASSESAMNSSEQISSLSESEISFNN